MAEVCAKHDVVKKDGKCWCCDVKQEKPAEKSSEVKPVATGGK